MARTQQRNPAQKTKIFIVIKLAYLFQEALTKKLVITPHSKNTNPLVSTVSKYGVGGCQIYPSGKIAVCSTELSLYKTETPLYTKFSIFKLNVNADTFLSPSQFSDHPNNISVKKVFEYEGKLYIAYYMNSETATDTLKIHELIDDYENGWQFGTKIAEFSPSGTTNINKGGLTAFVRNHFCYAALLTLIINSSA